MKKKDNYGFHPHLCRGSAGRTALECFAGRKRQGRLACVAALAFLLGAACPLAAWAEETTYTQIINSLPGVSSEQVNEYHYVNNAAQDAAAPTISPFSGDNAPSAASGGSGSSSGTGSSGSSSGTGSSGASATGTTGNSASGTSAFPGAGANTSASGRSSGTGSTDSNKSTRAVTSSNKSGSASSSTGPGSGSGTSSRSGSLAVQVEGDSQSSGPKLVEVTMSESYHEDFGIYEEGLGDKYFIYVNVANGGMTDQVVSLDIPENVRFTLEKDGVEIPYASGQALAERGSYMFYLTAVEDTSKPFSQQTVYQSTFRFRIQDRLPQAAQKQAAGDSTSVYVNGQELSPGTDPLSGAPSQSGWVYGISDAQNNAYPYQYDGRLPGNVSNGGVYGGTSNGGAANETLPEESPSEEALPEESLTQEAGLEESLASEGGEPLMNDDGTVNQEAIDQAISQAVGTASEEGPLDPFTDGAGFSSAIDEESGYYKNELLTGAIFYTNVPNGMITDNPVALTSSDDITFTVLLDGEEIPYEPGQNFEESGSYTILPAQDTARFISAYSNRANPAFHFRILAGPVRDLGIFCAPADYVIQSVSYEGVELPAAVAEDGSFARLERDGSYAVRMANGYGEREVALTRDSVRPRFHVSLEKNRAEVAYLSSDLASARLYKNGEEVSQGGVPSIIDGAGNYRLEVYDAAGNMGAAEFSIEYRFNRGAVMVIVLLVLLVVALVFFLLRTRRMEEPR